MVLVLLFDDHRLREYRDYNRCIIFFPQIGRSVRFDSNSADGKRKYFDNIDFLNQDRLNEIIFDCTFLNLITEGLEYSYNEVFND